MMKLRLLCFLLAASVLTGACGDEDDGTGPGPDPGPEAGVARLRVVQAEPKVASVDVFVDGTKVLSNMTYLTVSEYLEVESGIRDVQFVTASRTLDGAPVALADGADYTVIPCCTQFPGASLFTDDNSAPAPGNAKLRVVDYATIESALDIYVTAPGADLAAETPTVTISMGYASDYLEVPAGDYQVRITPWDTKTVVIDSGTLTLGAGQVRTAIGVDAAGGGEPFGLLVLEDLN